MVWKSSVEIKDILSRFPEIDEVKYAFSLANITVSAIFPDWFTADDEWTRIVVPTESGKLLLQAVGDSPVSRLALLGQFFHLDLLIDCTASDLDAIRQRLDSSLQDKSILLPNITGRELYDKYNDEFASNRTDHLDPPEVYRLLDSAPTGVYQIGRLVTGPFGILDSSEIRWVPPSSNAPLWHCSDTGCSALHQVWLRSGHQEIVDASDNITKEAIRTFGPASEWYHPLLAKIMRPDDSEKEILFSNIVPFIASCIVGSDRTKLILTVLKSDSRHRIRRAIEATPQSKRLRESSAEDLSSILTPEEQLQLLALIPTRELVALLDRLIRKRDILVQPEELRTASISPRRSSKHDLATEMSSEGLRSSGRRSLVRLQNLIIQAYTETATLDDLRWRIRAPDRLATVAALADYVRKEGPQATVRDLIFPERLVFERVSNAVFLERFPDDEPEQVVTRLLWKLGFDIARYAGGISLLKRRLEELNQCLLGLDATDSEESREQIRRSGVNLFVSLEDFLERLVSYNLWLCASDHFVDTKFSYNRHDAVVKVQQILGGSVRSGDTTFAWSLSGENTIGSTQSYLWKLLDWFSERQTADRDQIARADEDFPHYSQNQEQMFPFSHCEAWADFDRTEFEAYIGKLRGVAETLAKSKLAEIRNGLDHKRSAERFPTVDAMLAMVSRLREVVETADVNRLIPKRFWLEERNFDRYGRGSLLLKDYAGRPYLLALPMLVVSMPAVRFGAPVIIAPGSLLADGAAPVILSIRSSSEYARYWEGYPRRREVPPPRRELDPEQIEDGGSQLSPSAALQD